MEEEVGKMGNDKWPGVFEKLEHGKEPKSVYNSRERNTGAQIAIFECEKILDMSMSSCMQSLNYWSFV